MDFYKVFLRRTAEKELRSLSQPYLSQIIQKLKDLSHNPRPPGVQMLKGGSRYFRIRQGDYRVIYKVSNQEREVEIIKIGHRREVYE